IEKGAGPNWLFDIDSLTKSMNYMPVDAGTNSTNLLGTKDAANQEVKKDVSSLRYTVLPNWAHDDLLEFSSSKPHDESSSQVPKGSGNPNPTVSSSNPPTNQIETLTVESPIPTVSSSVPTACLNDSPEPSSEARLISKKVANQEETPSLDNILSLKNRKRVQRETSRSQNHAYMGPSHRSAGHRPHGAPMRPLHRSVGHRPHRVSMIPSNRPAGHRPHGPSMNPIRPNMNGARPNRSFFIQAPSYETRPFLKSSAVKTQYRAPWVSTVNRNNPPINRKFSTSRRNFPTVNKKFPTASRKFTTGSIKIYTADMGKKRKAVKSSACWTWNPSQKLSNKGPINNS
nr:hypothetical protein [Tanacetum cinerariifolium]